MKKLIAISLLLFYLFSTTELCQTLKVPILIEHYFEHKTETPEITILQFLKLHYEGNHLKEHPHDDDYNTDKKLPFIQHINVLNVVAFFSPETRFTLHQNSFPKKKEVFNLRELSFDSPFLSTIWQPPKYG